MIEPSYEEVRYQLQQTREALKSREQRLRELGVDDWVPLPAEEQPAVIKTCGHIKEDGWSCDSPAVTDRDLCHFHLGSRGRRLKMARARSRGERWLLQVPPLENLYSLQVGLMQVQDAMTNGQLDRRLGGVILYGLQQRPATCAWPERSGRILTASTTSAKSPGPALRGSTACPRAST